MARPAQKADLRLLSKVSKLYYEQGLTQQDIAERLHLSRPKVSRLIQQAVEEGIVQITVLAPPGIYSDLESQLETRYGLQEAVVIEVDPSAPASVISREVGIAAAGYLQRTIQGGDVIGITWGSSLRAMAMALQGCEVHDVWIVQMIGGLGPPESEVHATDLCRRIARFLNARLALISAPGIVDNLQVKAALLADSHVQTAYALFSKINVAYVGIGAPTADSVLRDSTIMSDADFQRVQSDGAVGDIALRFIDARGQPVHTDLDERVIGITLEQLKQVERVVGVAGGTYKETVVHSALIGGLIDVLITDNLLAAALIERA